MSLDKAIKSGKEKRKQYRGVKSFDPWCRNNRRDSIAECGKRKKQSQADEKYRVEVQE